MPHNLSQKLIKSHLVSGSIKPGEYISISIDQTLTQDATGTLVMLELEAMGVKQVNTEVSVQYVDHNILQTDFKNADDHIFLQSACDKFGIHFSGPGNGVSHPVHMLRIGIPGKTLLGSDSHTCAAGSMAMLAIGAGGLEVALAMQGAPFTLKMPAICGVRLIGKLPNFVSAKDVILEMLRRFDVDGGVGKIVEYYGPGLKCLSAMDRHVIANMGAELGATTSVFPSDDATLFFLRTQGREDSFIALQADKGASYDEHIEIDLSKLKTLIACPSSPGNVVAVEEVAGKPIYQSMIGSSANPGLRDFAIAAMMVAGKSVHPRVSFDVNPTSRQVLYNMTKHGYLAMLLKAGARIHQAGCNGCIGMGQAPATGRISLRTVPRNFPGRSGTREDAVYLCSPETAAASALTGVITDPRSLGLSYKPYTPAGKCTILKDMVRGPDRKYKAKLTLGPNIKPIPSFAALEDTISGPVLLKMGDNISTDEILPAGTKVLPYRSNIPEIAKFCFSQIDEAFYEKARKHTLHGFMVIAGSNYGQGSSREHAAIAPRFLGLRIVIAKSYARIHRNNLINFGIVPLVFDKEEDFDQLQAQDVISVKGLLNAIANKEYLDLHIEAKGAVFKAQLLMSGKERQVLLAGGMINFVSKTDS